MKKRFFILSMFIVILFLSCELFPTNEDQYFWTLDSQYKEKNKDVDDEEDKVPIEISLSSNQIFIMTHGGGNGDFGTPGYSTKQEAEANKNNMSFTLIGDNGISFDKSSYIKTVENHSKFFDNWHINQIFNVNDITIGETYSITGTTIFTDSSLAPVISIIKVIFR